MKKILKPAMALMIAAAAGAHAEMKTNDIEAARALFAGMGCVNCHERMEKATGPALKEIAKRYQGKNEANELAGRIREGSMGRWGNEEVHPPQGVLEPEEAKLLANWVLSGAP